eukprot:jgi/Picsp_1/1136/NSC_04617-R1_hypothetical protein AURANDRAFT_62044 [Aureococcus anophagefferens]
MLDLDKSGHHIFDPAFSTPRDDPRARGSVVQAEQLSYREVLQPFIVLSTQRCGSNYLGHLLHAINGIACFGEALVQKDNNIQRAEKSEDLISQLWDIFTSEKSKRNGLKKKPATRSIGFLMKYDHHSLSPDQFADVLRKLRIRVIHLVRQSSIEIFLSGKDHAAKYSTFIHDVASIDLSRFLNRYDRTVSEYRSSLNEASIPTLEVTYENVYQNPDQWVRAITNFLQENYTMLKGNPLQFIGKSAEFKVMLPCWQRPLPRVKDWQMIQAELSENVSNLMPIFLCENDQGRNLTKKFL